MTTTKAIELSQFASTVSVDANNNVEFSGDFAIADKIVHSGDIDTSIRFPANDTVTVETAGAERFRVTSAGNVGIGTSSPSAKLDVAGGLNLTAATTENSSINVGLGRTGDGNSFIDLIGDPTYSDYGARFIRVAGANGATSIQHRGTGSLNLLAQEAAAVIVSTNNAERMRIDSAGNVGIGTTTISTRLTVSGTTSSTDFAAGNGTAAAPAFDFTSDTNTGIYLAAADTLGFSTNGTAAAQFTSTGNLRLFNTAGTFYSEFSNQPTANRTITIPDVTGTILTTAGLATQAQAQAGTDNTVVMTPLRTKESLNASGGAPMYACRAWVNFNGSTTPPTILASGNVSSVTRASTGRFQINFTTAMPAANFSMLSISAAQTLTSWRFVAEDLTIARVSTSASILVGRHSDSSDGGVFDYQNPTGLNLAIFR
jgi:hypothetical protein